MATKICKCPFLDRLPAVTNAKSIAEEKLVNQLTHLSVYTKYIEVGGKMYKFKFPNWKMSVP